MPRSSRPEDGPRGDAGDAALTPELALVSPELAAAGRRLLPDRPWEVVSTDSSARTVAEKPAVSHGRARPLGARPSRVEMENAARSSRRRRFLFLVVAVVAVIVTVGRVTDGSGVEDRRDDRRDAGGERVLPDALLFPNAGFVVHPSGRFLTSASGREVESFVLPIRCGPRPLALDRVPIRRRTARYRGRAVREPVTVDMTMRVVDKHRVRGVVHARGSGCPGQPVRFTGRVS